MCDKVVDIIASWALSKRHTVHVTTRIWKLDGAKRRQLGPVVRSLHAQRGGLPTSMLERLIAHHEQLAPQCAQRGIAAPSSETSCHCLPKDSQMADRLRTSAQVLAVSTAH
jgi:hypothetical protein